jgi:hypothetical protein
MKDSCARMADAAGVLAVAWGRRAGRSGPDLTQYHVIHNWLWLGAVERWTRQRVDPSARRI